MLDYNHITECVKNMSRTDKDKRMSLIGHVMNAKEELPDMRNLLDTDRADATERARIVYNLNKEDPTIGLPILQHALGVSSSAYYHAKKIYESHWSERYYNGFVVVVLADAIITAKKPHDFEKEYPGVPIDQFLF